MNTMVSRGYEKSSDARADLQKDDVVFCLELSSSLPLNPARPYSPLPGHLPILSFCSETVFFLGLLNG